MLSINIPAIYFGMKTSQKFVNFFLCIEKFSSMFVCGRPNMLYMELRENLNTVAIGLWRDIIGRKLYVKCPYGNHKICGLFSHFHPCHMS